MFSLGVDPGLRFPAASLFSKGGVLVASATLTIGRDLRGGERLATIRRRLEEFIQPWGVVTGAAVEGPSLNSTHREYDLGEASGVIRGYVYERFGLEMQVVEPARLKLFATGNGQASKKSVVAYAVRHKPGLGDEDDDEADAIVLGEMAWALEHPKRRPTRAQAEVLHALKAPKTPSPRRTMGVAGRTNNL